MCLGWDFVLLEPGSQRASTLELYKNKSAAEMRLKADTAPTHRYELIKLH
jgi:hypothetical protein